MPQANGQPTDNELKAMYASPSDEYHDLFSFGMALEDELHDAGLLNDSSYRCRELTDFITRMGACLQNGTTTRRVLKQAIDEKSVDGQLVLPAGYDLKEAAKLYLEKCKPHWQNSAPASDLAAQAFGLDGITPTLKAQAEYLKTECGGSVELFAAKAKEFNHPGIGRLAQGQRPAHDKSKQLPPAADAIRKNPWLTEPKNLHDPNDPVMQRRISIIRGMGSKVAAQLAKSAGRSLSGQRLPNS